MAASSQAFPDGWDYSKLPTKPLMLVAQEVQSNHFYDFLQPELTKHGYSAVYKKKTMEIYTGNLYAIDGCATFFKKDKFGLVKKYEVSNGRMLPSNSITLRKLYLGRPQGTGASLLPCSRDSDCPEALVCCTSCWPVGGGGLHDAKWLRGAA